MEDMTSQIGILIVDDDREICDYMETFLSQKGYFVKTITASQDAIEIIKTGYFNIIILDLMMPKMDGIELLKRIRSFDTEIAVIIFTGYPSLETAVASMKLDIVDYIKKPFNPEQFRTVLNKVIRRKGLLKNPEDELHQAIGLSIRLERRRHNLTLKQLARRTSLSVSLLSQIERAESSASISSLFKISTALNISMKKFFGEF